MRTTNDPTTPSPPPRLLAPTLCALLVLAACTQRRAPDDPSIAFTHHPTSAYDTRTIEGFTVRVSPHALAHRSDLDPALLILQRQLQRTLAQTPDHAHDTLRAVEIWIEHDNPDTPGACYHPSADWLRDNDYNTDKARSIEIGNTANFARWVNTDQPSMILHELAHAYHHTHLGYDDERITHAYEHARSSGTYESVAHVSGDTRTHYALTNDREYFAELSESYFGYNDFFPFTRDQLRAHDPRGYTMIQQTWLVQAWLQQTQQSDLRHNETKPKITP